MKSFPTFFVSNGVLVSDCVLRLSGSFFVRRKSPHITAKVASLLLRNRSAQVAALPLLLSKGYSPLELPRSFSLTD